jgi:hypothetical protein
MSTTPVFVNVSYPRGRCRIEFSRPGRRASAVLDSNGQVALAIALGLNGARVPRNPSPGEVAELVMRGIERHGADHIRELEEWDRTVANKAIVNGTATRELLRRQSQLWGNRRTQDACISLAYNLTHHAETTGVGAPAIPTQAARRGGRAAREAVLA